MVHMRTTLDLDENLLEEARQLTGITGKTALLHRGLREIIQRESARLLARMGGSAPRMKAIPRRRPSARSVR
jgi:Arc/MetJ family transcription regulator